MIDENEIEQSALEYADQNWEKPYYSSSVPNAAKDSFMAGAKWALEQSQWIAGCPENNKHYIFYLEFIVNGKPAFEVITGYVDEENGELYYYNDDWYGASAKEVVIFHMPLPELPKQ